jgi:hypothetical protein
MSDLNFNENELLDIMAEIESLESNAAAPVKHSSVAEDLAALEAEVQNEMHKNEQSTLLEQAQNIIDVATISEKKDAEILEVNLGKELGLNNQSLNKVITNDLEIALQNEIDQQLSNIMGSSKTDPVLSIKQGPNNLINNPKTNTNEEKMNNSLSKKSSLELNVAGDMNLDLVFNVAGNKVQLYIDAQNGLTIELPGGAKFCIPIEENVHKKVS